MLLFPLLRTLHEGLTAPAVKVHLASSNGSENPVNELLEGRFDSWQSYQAKQNFPRPQVLALIALPQTDRWLYAGLFDSHGCASAGGKLFKYDLSKRSESQELIGRLIVAFHRPGRQSYLLAEHWEKEMRVASILPEPLSVGEFPGYSKVRLIKPTLDIIVRQQIASWKSALASVAGVYLITDTQCGELYVGSATGLGGIW